MRGRCITVVGDTPQAQIAVHMLLKNNYKVFWYKPPCEIVRKYTFVGKEIPIYPRSQKKQIISEASYMEALDFASRFKLSTDEVRLMQKRFLELGIAINDSFDILNSKEKTRYYSIDVEELFPVSKKRIVSGIVKGSYVIHTSPIFNIRNYVIHLECGKCCHVDISKPLAIASHSDFYKKICITSDGSSMCVSESFLSGTLHKGKIGKSREKYEMFSEFDTSEYLNIAGGNVPVFINENLGILDVFCVPKTFDTLRSVLLLALFLPQLLTKDTS